MISRSVLLETVIGVVVRTSLVFALYLLFSGHNAPGGGFVAGLVVGSALLLRYLTGGAEEVDFRVVSSPEAMIGAGVGMAVATGGWGWLRGAPFLTMTLVETEVPVLGAVKASTALVFDLGVFLVVQGICVAAITALGRGEPA